MNGDLSLKGVYVMKSEVDTMQPRKINNFQRLLAVLLTFLMVFSLCGTELIPVSRAVENTQQEMQVETREEIKTRLMRQIRYEGWDPYSADMSLDEFYALMELFGEGKLPLNSAAKSSIGATGMEGPSIDGESSSDDYIPRTMFLFGGLDAYEGELNKPLDYDNENGNGVDYPARLDPYDRGYKRPPETWAGVPLENGAEVFVLEPGTNADDPSIAGDVVQNLFLQYEGHYVRRITAQNTEVTVLGAIKLKGSNNYVYYYLTDGQQEHDVSTTMLPEGQKFIVEYSVSEHKVDYQLYMNELDGSDVLPDGVSLDSVFGADRPTKTEDGKYAFTATAPYGYTLILYLLKPDDETTGGKPVQALKYDPSDDLGDHLYADVNEGWALGMDPDYTTGNAEGGAVTPNTQNGPSTLTWSGTFYNNQVHFDRTVIGVLKPKGEPRFLFAPLYHGIANVSGRGSVAKSWYETELDYAVNVSHDPALVKAAEESGHIGDYRNTGRAGGFPNVFTDDGWNWNNYDAYKGYVKMTKDPDGTYSHSFTFQTNSSDNYVLDSLSVNGFSITIPFYPKYAPIDNNDLRQATGVGVSQWITETVLPDGVKVKVEYLLVFGNAQRHYRITVSGAQSDVVISGMNLMQYRSGAAEFSAYHLNGIIEGDTSSAGVQYYAKNNEWRTALLASINVDEATTGFGLNTDGFSGMYGANFRFKLADGYDSPYFLWESTQSGMIADQGSGFRDEFTGEVTTINPVKPLSALQPGETMDSNTIYGPDQEGYYYFRVSTQLTYKIALLTIVARPVRYVVRYVPSYKDVGATAPTGSNVGIVENPANMPAFTHSLLSGCHESFLPDTDNGIPSEQYDDKDGAYYDTAIDTVVILPADIPTDPTRKYIFVDWVLVGEDYMPITVDGKEFHYRGSNITLSDISDYAIANENLGGDDTDIYVLRLMPTWQEITNPFNYKVALNWVDATGELHEEFFDDFWKEVLTDWNTQNGKLTVKVLVDATPFQDWIAQHPTYTFWDAVNNNNALYEYAGEHDGVVDEYGRAAVDEDGRAAMVKQMEDAIRKYLPFLDVNSEEYKEVLAALSRRDISGKEIPELEAPEDGIGNGQDDFWRLGEYAFQVFEDEGTIVVWMYEDKGGLAFSKNVQPESHLLDEDFYFTVSQVMTAFDTPLNGVYKAYPQTVYNEKGEKRARLDSDAWLVTFTNGTITSIVKNDDSHEAIQCFTLKDGEGIELYVPAGEYTITELGSRSGGTYRVEVIYDGKNADPTLSSGWTLPGGSDNTLLKGYEKTVCTHTGPVHGTHSGVSQVSATVRFEIGEANVVQTLQFTNMTSAVSVEKKVDATDENKDELQEWLDENRNQQFHFKVTLIVPEGYEPLYNDGSPYFTLNIYDAVTGVCIGQDELYVYKDAYGAWIGEIDLYNDQRADVVMAPPNDGKTLYAHRYVWDTDIGDFVIEPIEITSMADIEYRGGSPTPSYSTWLYDERDRRDILSYLYYLRDGINIDDPEAKLAESWIWVRDSKQLRTETKYVGDTTISHKSGYTLYYKIGGRYLKLPTSLSDVNLQAAIVDDVYQACVQKDVPLYYIPTEGGPYQPINEWSDLLAAVEAGVWCEIDGDYYPVELTEIDDEKAADGKYYEGLYQGIGGYRLKINCPVYVHDESNDFSGYSPVLRLNEILLQTHTADVPVSNEDIQYAFEEVWHEEDWDGVWDSNKEKPKIFIEEWAGQSGTMVTGTLIEAKIVNWYKNTPGEGYLAITEVGGDPNESFLYRITNTATGESLIVSVKGGGVTYVYAPLGEYTIEEITDWAWRYEDGKCVSPATGTNRATVTVTSENDTPENAMHADFTNKRNEKLWVGGESSEDNQFAGSETTDEEPGANSRKQEYAMPTVAYDFEKKKQEKGDDQ